MSEKMSFLGALKKLNIEEYAERIWRSNSHGEIMHVFDYIQIARLKDVNWFRKWFVEVVARAEKEWERPESIFQHIPKLIDMNKEVDNE